MRCQRASGLHASPMQQDMTAAGMASEGRSAVCVATHTESDGKGKIHVSPRRRSGYKGMREGGRGLIAKPLRSLRWMRSSRVTRRKEGGNHPF